MKTASTDTGHAYLKIDRGALRRNYERLADLSGNAITSAVVKANGYGLGIEQVIPTLTEAGCRHFFVAHTREGVVVRKLAGNDATIYVLNGIQEANAGWLRQAELIPVISRIEQIAQATAERLTRIALHFDTGMNRLGMAADQVEAAKAEAKELDVILVMSHLACADEPDHEMNAVQLTSFGAVRETFPGIPASLANSAGVMLGGDYLADMARPGIALYGGSPVSSGDHPFEPVAEVHAPILQIREVPGGQSAGYGATWNSMTARKLAVVPFGYADGLPRAAQLQGRGFIGNVPCAFAGRISMDLATLDITDAGDDVQVGTMIRFLGSDLEAMGRASGSFSYELLTRLGSRLVRTFAD